MILRLSLAAIALFAAGGTVVSATALLDSGDLAMAGWTLFYAWVAGVCVAAAWTLTAARDGGRT